MKAVIMAGGQGTRLRPLTCDLPKPMVPILGRPMMEHIILLLKHYGIREIAVTLCYLPEVMKEAFGDGSRWGVDLHYFVEETPLGTAGSVANAREFLDEPFIVISGDALTDINLSQVIEEHQEKQALASIVMTQVEAPLEYGVVITAPDGRIQRFLEKPSWSEVFSDLVNTGIYILEPEVLDWIPTDKPYDFSKDLFPKILEAKEHLFGLTASGYWSDIGNLEVYHQAHMDLLEGKVNLPHLSKQSIQISSQVEIDPTAQIIGPVWIDEGAHIHAQAKVGPGVVIGRESVISRGAQIQQTVAWSRTYLGRQSEVAGAVLADRVQVGQRSRVGDGVVIGKATSLGSDVQVATGVKIWPEKEIESGAILRETVVWGNHRPRALFGPQGVTGFANVDLIPEFVLRLGNAFGATLPQGAQVVVGSDTHQASRLLKKALMSGVLASGVNLYDLGSLTAPIARYAITHLDAAGGVHIHAREDGSVAMVFYDQKGLPLSQGAERGIENLFFREDYRRAEPEQIGHTAYLPRLAEEYLEGVLSLVDVEKIKQSKFRVLVGYRGPALSLLLPTLMERLGLDVQTVDSPQKMAQEVRESGADLGLLVESSGQEMRLFSPSGREVDRESMGALFTLILLRSGQRQVPAPVTAPEALERMAQQYQGQVIRTKATPRSWMEQMLAQRLLTDSDGQVYTPVYDALVGLVAILQALAEDEMGLDDLLAQIPQFHMVQQEVPCSWESKGKVMRGLIQATSENQRELLDGIKVYHDSGWALILPDASDPVFRIIAEGESPEEADALTQMYMEQIQEIIG